MSGHPSTTPDMRDSLTTDDGSHIRTATRRSRIGLFLNARRVDGGLFQTSLCILDALAALPRERYEVMVVYALDEWAPHVARSGVPARRVRVNRLAGLCDLWSWQLIFLPISLWRRASPLFHPVAKALVDARCDLWVFPAQDRWTYMAPVEALGSIPDLMHRHERQFPEVSARGLYHSRERHYRNTCRWTRGVFVDSELGRHHVRDAYGMALDRIFILPWLAPAHVSAAPPAGFDARYALPDKFVFYPAQFWLHKNHRTLIEAVARVRETVPDVHLVLTGAPLNGYELAMARVRELGVADSVLYFGYVPDEDIGEFYRRARAMVMPSFFGPTNTPPMEAFATGCPVATSNVYANAEQVGDAALLFDPRSAAELADCITRLWQDDGLCADLQRRGAARAAAWTQSHYNARFADHIDAALEKPPGRSRLRGKTGA